MFGYIVANKEALSPERAERYRGAYCGLCWALGERHGELCRLTLNYDMTFLVLLLSSMYEPCGEEGARRCAVHPTKKHTYWKNEFTDYAADMNVALAYHKCADDWKDDRNFGRLLQSKLLKSHYELACARHPRQTAAISSCMESLAKIEASGEKSPDAAANCFGDLMGEIFVCRQDSFSARFRALGQALGRFVYMMDACTDYERDKKRSSYNPLAFLGGESFGEEQRTKMLKMLIAEGTEIFEALPLVQDVDILRNVFYSGVWTQYSQKKQKRGAKDDKQSL